MYLLLACAYRWIAIHVPPVIPFSIINIILMSVNGSNSTVDFLILPKKNEQNPAYVFQSTCFKSIQTRQLIIMHLFEQINHVIFIQVFYSKFLLNSFRILISLIVTSSMSKLLQNLFLGNNVSLDLFQSLMYWWYE